MVCIRNLAGLLLALAAAPSVLSTPVVAREAKGAIDPLSLLPGDSSSASGGSGASVSNSPSASPSNPPTTSPAVTTPTVSATPTTGPTSVSSPSNSPSQTQKGSSQTSSPAPTTNIPASTSIAIALTTLPFSEGQSTFIVYQTQTTGIDGIVGTAFATQAVAAAPTETPSADTKTPPPSTMPVGTIVGIVVGVVGGVVLIGALIAVSWRIWGKNRHSAEEDDALMDDGVYGSSEVKGASGTSSTPSPFQNNLEQYHNGRANPSANF